MFKLYDLNLREIPFPDGVMPLDIFVGSISKTRETETIPGRNGVMNYGFNYDSRPVRITLLAEGNDRIDYRLIRNAVFELFDLHDVFYIEETDVPSRVLKVTIDESYQPDRLTRDDASFDINLRTLDSVFWESKYTTLELHDSGYSATAEKYGLVDNIDDEKVKYRFEPNFKKITFKASDFEQGSIATVSGANVGSATEIRTVSHFDTFPGETYVFKDAINGDSVNYWWLLEYDEKGGYLGFSNTPIGGNGEITFVAKGHRLRVRSASYNGIKPADVGVHTLPTLEGNDSNNKFTVYNAGNVTVEPEISQLYIQMNYVTSEGNLKVTNKTTGETFEYYRSVSRRHIVLNGMVMTESGTNRFRDSNRKFISLAPGDNEIEITGGTFEQVYFRFKYLYK